MYFPLEEIFYFKALHQLCNYVEREVTDLCYPN